MGEQAVKDFELLTPDDASYKFAKGRRRGWVNDGHYLAPASLSGVNVCAKSTPGCRATCLNTAGRGVYDNVQWARVRRTQMLFADREGYLDMLANEVARREWWARKRGYSYCFRPNGTSDLPWLAAGLAKRLPGLRMYDYTKLSLPWQRVTNTYSLTFSRAEDNERECLLALANGVNVAVVFSTRRHEELPTRYMGRRVFDGDVSDLRFLDPAGVIVGLRAKGKARHDTSGFVVQL